MVEEIRVIPSHPSYFATSQGRIWSDKSQLFLSPIAGRRGYWRVNLSEGGVRVNAVGIHRLVCEAFHGPAPEGKPWALHRDGDPGNNVPENLYWGDPQDNVNDMIRHGRHRSQMRVECPQGHPYNEGNTYLSPDGSRGCRACHRESMSRMGKMGLTPGDPRHGTNTGYANWRCRCAPCLNARREYISARR